MPISITCSNCDKTLKVPDEVAGKKVRCPACKNVIAVPAADEDEIVEEEEAPPPKRKSESVKSEKSAPPPVKGRDDDDDEAEDRDDEEEEDRPRRRKKRRDDDDEDDDDLDVRRKPRKPHRGGTVLTLGILSIVANCCCALLPLILGGIALNMANTDLTLMSSKKMDPSGQGSTQAGKICGIIGIVLGVLNFIASGIYVAMNPNVFK